jgi:hypothetical protein
MPAAAANPLSLARTMPQNEEVWDRIVAKHDLEPIAYADFVRSWQFADYLFGHGRGPEPLHVSTIKIRKAGFHECVDSEEMFLDLLRQLQQRRMLPG